MPGFQRNAGYTADVLSIADGGSAQNLTIQCTPSASGARTATLSGNLYAELHRINPASGSGLQFDPATIPAMSATVGTSPTTTLTVNNTGTASMNVTGITFGGTDSGKFSVSPNTFPASIAASGNKLYTVTCNGSTAGSYSATMEVTHNATGSPANYTLSCTVSVAAVTAGVILNSMSNVTGSTVLASATATGTGITERGFFWWIPPTAATHFGGSESGLIPEGGYGAGSFSLNLTGLKPGNKYHVKAYIKVGGQIITSDEQLFTTAATGETGKSAPTVITESCTLNTDGTVSASGEITDIGSSAVNVYGFVYAKHPAPYTGDNMASTGDRALALWDKAPVYQGMSFAGTVKNLTPGKWYLRAYAHNDNPDSDAAQTASLGYGADCTFTVPCTPETCIPGDVNGDGHVELDDAMPVLSDRKCQHLCGCERRRKNR